MNNTNKNNIPNHVLNRSIFGSILSKFNIKNLIYFYSISVILFSLIDYYVQVFTSNQILRYSVKDLLLIGFGSVFYQISIIIFPILLVLFLYGIYVGLKNNKKVFRFITKQCKVNLILSIFISLLVVYLNHVYGVDKNVNTILYIVFYSFITTILVFSAFSSLIRNIVVVFHTRSYDIKNGKIKK